LLRFIAAHLQSAIRSFLMKKLFFTSLAIASLVGVSAASAATAPKPRISMATARAMALKLAPGKIISSEYEKEGGIWRYSFDIQQKDHVQEIGIDGRTGKIVENKSEGKKDTD
jgi:uncharacterized membrane protein YkoI